MRKTWLIILLILSFKGFCQSTQDCEKILKKEINLNVNDPDNLKRFLEDFSLLKNCGFDNIDIAVFSNGSVLGLILFELALDEESDSKLTFQKLYDKVLEIKESEDYELTKTTILVLNDLEKRPADIDNWKEDKVLLEKLHVPYDYIDKFYNYLKEYSTPEKTYKQVLADFDKIQKPEKKETEPDNNDYDEVFKNVGNVNYEDLLNESIKLKKPLLLYFNGFACINARKMETYVLSDSTIIEILKNKFYLVNLFVDDRTSLPENENIVSKTNGKLLKYVGQKHSELQITKFNNSNQPYFVIIDEYGNKIKEQGYTTDIKLFKELLTIEK
jgi:hypothetical protein